MYRTVFLVLAGVSLVACSGTIRTRALDLKEVEQSKLAGAKDDLPGVVFYPPALFNEISKTTTIVDAHGNVTHTALGGAGTSVCKPKTTTKVISRPDYERPRLIYYDAALLESYKFGMTMTGEGLLTGVNNESTPDRGQTLKNLADASSAVAPIGMGTLAITADTRECTNGAVVVDYTYYKVPHPPKSQ